MIPHQVVDIVEPTPLRLPLHSNVGVPRSAEPQPLPRRSVPRRHDRGDGDQALRSRNLSAIGARSCCRAMRRWEQIVRDEVTARSSADREGMARPARSGLGNRAARSARAERRLPIEKMARFISEHALEDISEPMSPAPRVFHPNYAMTLFKRVIGQTFAQAIVRQRLDTAQSLLIATTSRSHHRLRIRLRLAVALLRGFRAALRHQAKEDLPQHADDEVLTSGRRGKALSSRLHGRPGARAGTSASLSRFSPQRVHASPFARIRSSDHDEKTESLPMREKRVRQRDRSDGRRAGDRRQRDGPRGHAGRSKR